jgi:Carboxypeptidase regulatory-like domain
MSPTSKRINILVFRTVCLSAVVLAFGSSAMAQRTLGGITGTVTDKTGSVLPETNVTIVADETQLTRTQRTNANGSYNFVDLPIGAYTLTFVHEGFQSQKIPSILVQADRTVTVNATLPVGQVGTVVEVDAVPLVNAVDTTNGYILEKNQIDAVPLSTGSFTGLAILSPGVSAELPGGTGVNSGLGNQPIWANGQRDTSNSFLVNGVDASNLFNGKSTSQVASARIVNNTGVANAASTSAAPIQSTASVYLAIGQAIPTPAPETVQEVRVNTSMYDAQQGSTSGAHIDMSTASGTNAVHGSAYLHRGTDWLNAAPFFYKQDPNLPANDKVPQMHRYTAGGTLGGALIKDKLFGYVAFQHLHDSDQEIGLSRMLVPADFNPTFLMNATGCGTTTRTDPVFAQCLADISNDEWGTSISAANVSPVALSLFQAKAPNGQYLIPFADGVTPTPIFPENAISPGTAYFAADQAVTNLDWNRNSKNTISAKYYYQHDPTVAPYAYSNVPGFPQYLDAGSQVASLTNAQSIRPDLAVTEVIGILREKAYSTIGQPFTPQQLGINTFGSTYFPGITIVDPLGLGNPAANPEGIANLQFLTIGQGSASQGAFTGVFQNRIMPSANAIWMKGRNTITFGGSYAYTQLNTRDDRTNQGMISTADFSQFVQGIVNTNDDFTTTKFLQGNANRYYRAGQVGVYVQDKFQFRSNLSMTAGLRFDWNGGLTEKYGRIFNFDPALYSYDGASDAITSNGFIIAGNNKLFPTKGVSNTTLTGRQWGLAPRLGMAWSPRKFNDKLVVRTGTGLYYDRGELFTYLSPGYAEGVINGGPFGVNQTPPYVNAYSCQNDPNATITYYLGYIPSCPTPTYSLSSPWGPAPGPAPTGNPADITGYLPNEAAIVNGAELFSFATYNRANKLPYTINYTLDIQWQPRNDLAFDIGYVGNVGRHGVIPIPFNQPGIASPSNVIHPDAPYPQSYTYGYTVQSSASCSPACPINLPNGQPMLASFEGGNVDLRVPYIGYSAESETYKAAGVSAYNALQAHMEKRLSHGLQLGFSYTYSHALDEQSAMGLFFNGNNPLDLRSAYGSSDFDRTHVFNISYRYELPGTAQKSSLLGKVTNGWAITGVGVFQSGQPYSIIDYTGAVGSIYFSVYDGITNPIVPLAPGCTAKNALTGASGAYANSDPTDLNLYALKQSCFTLPLLNPGDLGGAIPPGDTFETNFTTGQRNIFRQAWQRRLDASLVKTLQIDERVSLKYTLDVFNVTNTTSFDIPIDDVSQNEFYNQFPIIGLPLYNAPSGLGAVNKIIGSPRQIQMTLHLVF